MYTGMLVGDAGIRDLRTAGAMANADPCTR
jgi:hypothetical protein